MFGYVTPCKMELKIKDYEKFKGYYCGLCMSIKKQFGNLPRLALNYDMTFLALLIDSISEEKRSIIQNNCIIHPFKKRIMVVNNKSINYAAFCNVALAYYKLLDDVDDNDSLKGKIFSKILNSYMKNNCNNLENVNLYIKNNLDYLQTLEQNPIGKTIDELSHPFADLTGYIISYYYKNTDIEEKLYWLGYNLGKWIYIIDAWDDLEKDIQSNSFNAIEAALNKNKLKFKDFKESIKERIDFILVSCAQRSVENLNNLPLKRNEDLLYNILQFGLMEKMDNVFKRSEFNNERSI